MTSTADRTAAQTSLRRTPIHPVDSADAPWWHDAVIYQIYPRSWADADGDGVGDLAGVTARLPYLRDLGVDAVWLSPFYVSPMNDAGYDVADYRDIDPLFGTLADADALIATAHGLGLKVLVDLVPNHSSAEHAWFRAALAAAPGSPERARYLFRDGTGPHGNEPPNNWPSVFGGPGWTRVTEADGSPGQWYLHLFDTTQPDFDWTNPEVREEFHDILRFWLGRGVDGFRVDVAHGLVKEAGLPDWHGTAPGMLDAGQGDQGDDHDHGEQSDHGDVGAAVHETGFGPRPPMWDQDGVHEIYRGWREVLDEFTDPQRILCAEAWVQPEERLARYLRPGEMHQAFNFEFLETAWQAGPLRDVIAHSLASNDRVGAPTTWVLSNHDVVRHASRLGLDQSLPRPNGIGADDPQPDQELGLRRARAATTLMLALPGGAYLYQGEELGLPEATDLPDDVRQDPTFAATKGEQLGRDGCRIPMPWTATGPSLGFGPGERTWLPQPEAYGSYAVDQQTGVAGSTLELYRTLLALRADRDLGTSGLATVDGLGADVVAFEATSPTGLRTVVVANLGADLELPPQLGDVLVASDDLTGRTLPTDTAVWLADRQG